MFNLNCAKQYSFLVLLLSVLIGCSSGATGKFIPPVESAEEALEVMLREWKAGKSIGPIESVDPTVQPVDSRWQTKQKLLDYTILKEMPAEGMKQFQVRLKLADQSEPEETVYIVLGKDPLFVYWKSDFDKASQSM